jgi:protocatechuate 3,4-dioxygenase beta subunit
MSEHYVLPGLQFPRREPPPADSTIETPTPKQVWGPFYVLHAPFRCKLSPIGAKGTPILISGHIYGFDTKKPLPFTVVDVWQDDPETETYDYYEESEEKRVYTDTLNTVGKAKTFTYRARFITDEYGYYELETLLPVAYFDPDDGTWRCPHVHYLVRAVNYKELVTQLYFEGMDKNDIVCLNSLFFTHISKEY